MRAFQLIQEMEQAVMKRETIASKATIATKTNKSHNTRISIQKEVRLQFSVSNDSAWIDVPIIRSPSMMLLISGSVSHSAPNCEHVTKTFELSLRDFLAIVMFHWIF